MPRTISAVLEKFCLDLYHEAEVASLLQLGLVPFQLGDLRIPRTRRRAAPRLLQPGWRPGIPRTAPLADQAGIQASRRSTAPFSPFGRRHS